jgi:uncharacterized membrane protein (DUF373 family)
MLKVSIGALITWILPLLLSFGLYNPETKIYIPSYIGFKVIMALTAAFVCYFTMRWISKKQQLGSSSPAIYLALNSALDLFLLVYLFAMPIMFWVTTIFPVYVIVFFGAFFIVRRSRIPQ